MLRSCFDQCLAGRMISRFEAICAIIGGIIEFVYMNRYAKITPVMVAFKILYLSQCLWVNPKAIEENA